MTLEAYFLYLGAVAIFFATPPDTNQLLIISNSARHGLRRSLWTVFGDLSANAIQITAAAFGLAALIAGSAEAFQAVKWAGVAYLIWIGARLMLSRGAADAPGAGAERAPGRLFRQGFVTSMANPFAVVFFGALFPQFIDPAAPVAPQLAMLGASYLIVDGAILIAWGRIGVRARAALRLRGTAVSNRICGGLMIAAAALLAAKDMTPAAQR